MPAFCRQGSCAGPACGRLCGRGVPQSLSEPLRVALLCETSRLRAWLSAGDFSHASMPLLLPPVLADKVVMDAAVFAVNVGCCLGPDVVGHDHRFPGSLTENMGRDERFFRLFWASPRPLF